MTLAFIQKKNAVLLAFDRVVFKYLRDHLNGCYGMQGAVLRTSAPKIAPLQTAVRSRELCLEDLGKKRVLMKSAMMTVEFDPFQLFNALLNMKGFLIMCRLLSLHLFLAS
jgi:hypothetical protein